MRFLEKRLHTDRNKYNYETSEIVYCTLGTFVKILNVTKGNDVPRIVA